MQVLCLGLSHQSAPVEIRERLSYSDGALKAALARFGCGRDALPSGVAELTILSTCNRTELYACGEEFHAGNGAPRDAFAPLIDFLVETRGVHAGEFESHLYRLGGADAVEHLCRVASGLDSMILGEPQILGQVASAHEAALGQQAAGPVLSALFRTAIAAGKRARTETAIGRNPATVSSVAVRLAESVVGDLRSARVLIVGAGEMAELAVEALRVRGVRRIAVVSRTLGRAEHLAERWGGEAMTFERLAEALAAADIVITSTDAPHFIIVPDLVQAARDSRPDRPHVFIDIAVPRDVDPAVGRLPGVHCFDIDDLQQHLNGSIAVREREVPRVEEVVREEVERFLAWQRSLDVVPVIAGLRAKAESIRRAEVDRTLRHLPRLGETERKRIEALSESIVSKLLHDVTARLKSEADNGHAPEYAAAVRELFGL